MLVLVIGENDMMMMTSVLFMTTQENRQAIVETNSSGCVSRVDALWGLLDYRDDIKMVANIGHDDDVYVCTSIT